MRAIAVGHREHEYTFLQCDSHDAFKEFVAGETIDDEKETEKRKQEYEIRGLDWRTGRKIK